MYSCSDSGLAEVNQRRFPRKPVELDTTCMFGSMSAVTGTVVNISAGGVCFTPEAGYVDGECTEELLQFFDVGSYVNLELRDGARVSACVRWRGLIDGAQAVGLEYGNGSSTKRFCESAGGTRS